MKSDLVRVKGGRFLALTTDVVGWSLGLRITEYLRLPAAEGWRSHRQAYQVTESDL